MSIADSINQMAAFPRNPQPGQGAAPPAFGTPGYRPTMPASPMGAGVAAPQGGGAAAGQWQPFGNSPMVPNVQTSVQPTGVYTPQQTQQSVNQQLAALSANNNLRQLLHGTDQPGISRSAGSMQGVLPQIGAARGNAAYVMQQQPFSDAQANAQQMLQGQQAQGNEWMGLAGAANGMNQNVINNNYSNANFLLSLLSGLGLFST